MKKLEGSNLIVVSVDHGYGNMKTANFCFPTGVKVWDTEPTFGNDVLYNDGKYYTIGAGHKEYISDKADDLDFYLLTLAAIARELNTENIHTAEILLAAGLPLTWVGEQKEEFKKYLLKNKTVDYTFRDKEYHVTFAGAEIFPQGFAAVANQLHEFKGANMLCDIGNGTMNILRINDRRPVPDQCYTEKYGTYQCTLAAMEALLKKLGKAVDESIIERVLRFGEANVSETVQSVISATTREYVSGIMRRLREHGYDPELMRLYVVGGGSCLIKNFFDYDPNSVTINQDVCATAKGYELMAERKWKRMRGVET